MTRLHPDTATSIRLEIDVDVSVERAYQVFTHRADDFTPRDQTILPVELAETVLEPWPGGRLYDRGVDGQLCSWGRVLVAEAPNRLLFTWDITPTWQLETDPDCCSEVEVTFTAVGPDRTHVVLEHRHLDRHGDGWEGERDAVAADEGWPLYLDRFRSLVG